MTEVADGELPYFQVGDWEDLDYVRPDYIVPSTVEILHGWLRVAGDNEFDLSERAYGEKKALRVKGGAGGARKARDFFVFSDRGRWLMLAAFTN